MIKERGEQCVSSVTDDIFGRRLSDIQGVVKEQRVFVGYCSRRGEGADGADALPLFAVVPAVTPNHILYTAAILTTTTFRKKIKVVCNVIETANKLLNSDNPAIFSLVCVVVVIVTVDSRRGGLHNYS